MKKVINICMYIFLAIFTLEMMIKVKIQQRSSKTRLIPKTYRDNDMIESKLRAKMHRADAPSKVETTIHCCILLNCYFIAISG